MTDNHLRMRPKKGWGFYMEIFDNHSICLEFLLNLFPPVVRIQLPRLLIEIGIMNREESDRLDKFFTLEEE